MTYGGLTVEQLAALESAATPGPWHVSESERFSIYGPGRIDKYGSRVGVTGIGNVSGCVNFAKNSALIAAARNALPELLARIEELEAVRFRLLNELQDMAISRMALAQRQGAKTTNKSQSPPATD